VKIVCASSVLFGREAFETLGEVVVLPDGEIGPAALKGADALIVRSKTDITEALLGACDVSFVGTATAGTDHLDVDYLNHRMIGWCAAPGCNANSVAEYVLTALLCLAGRHDLELAGRKIGVIGVGQVGGRVAQQAQVLGLEPLRNDPPLQMATGDPNFLPLDYVLRNADFVTLHVPLTTGGPFPTRHMVNCRFFARARGGLTFINTARGEVVEAEALRDALEHGVLARLVLDVWEREPEIAPELLARTDLATPHIAGYSFEGRLNGTLAVYREACHFFEIEGSWMPDELLFPPAPEISLDARGLTDEAVLREITRRAYDIEADDRALRAGIGADATAAALHFEQLRRNYPPRREFTAVKLRIAHAEPALLEKVAALGFQVMPF